MRKARLTTLALALLALSVFLPLGAGNAQAFFGKDKSIRGSGHLETRDFELEGFDEISVGGSFEVRIAFGDRQQVAVTVDDNLWDNLELKVRNGRLVVDWDKSCRPDDACRLTVTVPSLQAMTVHGAARVDILDFSGEKFAFELSGAAELEMSGAVDRLDLQVSGAGNIDTHKLQARQVKVRISGAGNAEIAVSENLDAAVSGVGNVTYWGDPARKQVAVSGLGNISAR